MATVGSFDRTKGFSELNEPINTGSGMVSPATRKAAARANLGVPASNVLSGITALTAASGVTGNTVVDVGAAFSQTTLNNNFKVLADKINAILAALD